MKNGDSIEDLVTRELPRLLSASPGPDSIGAPLENLCGALEILVPRGLARTHPEWRGETLDGLLVDHLRKTSEMAVVLTGVCILMSDQSLTPFSITLALDQERGLAARVAAPSRQGRVEWVYSATWPVEDE